MKPNCWEVNTCGRETGGEKVAELGVCPAAALEAANGINGGRNAGRVCWAVYGTFCEGEAQTDMQRKRRVCDRCAFYHQVAATEGPLQVLFWS